MDNQVKESAKEEYKPANLVGHEVVYFATENEKQIIRKGEITGQIIHNITSYSNDRVNVSGNVLYEIDEILQDQIKGVDFFLTVRELLQSIVDRSKDINGMVVFH